MTDWTARAQEAVHSVNLSCGGEFPICARCTRVAALAVEAYQAGQDEKRDVEWRRFVLLTREEQIAKAYETGHAAGVAEERMRVRLSLMYSDRCADVSHHRDMVCQECATNAIRAWRGE